MAIEPSRPDFVRVQSTLSGLLGRGSSGILAQQVQAHAASYPLPFTPHFFGTPDMVQRLRMADDHKVHGDAYASSGALWQARERYRNGIALLAQEDLDCHDVDAVLQELEQASYRMQPQRR